jgi:hypothetical protein
LTAPESSAAARYVPLRFNATYTDHKVVTEMHKFLGSYCDRFHSSLVILNVDRIKNPLYYSKVIFANA